MVFAGAPPQNWSCCSFVIVSDLKRTFMEPHFTTKWEVMIMILFFFFFFALGEFTNFMVRLSWTFQ